jgi:hypothetical protein
MERCYTFVLSGPPHKTIILFVFIEFFYVEWDVNVLCELALNITRKLLTQFQSNNFEMTRFLHATLRGFGNTQWVL